MRAAGVSLQVAVLRVEHVSLLPHLRLLLHHPVLLVADDAARPTDAQPGDRLGCRQPVVLHQVAADEGAGATQTGCWRAEGGGLDSR